MKILAMSDFHGELPVDLPKICKQESIDVVISAGDFCGFHLRELFFKKIYARFDRTVKIPGHLSKIAEKKDVEDGIRILNKLAEVNKPIFIVTGNIDKDGLAEWKAEKADRLLEKDYITPIANSLGINIINFKSQKFKEFTLIGSPHSSSPGKRMKKGKYRKTLFSSKNFEEWRSSINSSFKSAESPIIFVSHNVPYRTKMDLIGQKAHKIARGKHYGSIITREMIEKYQPLLCICGHMHENQGVEMLGKTTVVNSGFGAKGEYAIIDVNKDKVNVKLVKGEKWK